MKEEPIDGLRPLGNTATVKDEPIDELGQLGATATVKEEPINVIGPLGTIATVEEKPSDVLGPLGATATVEEISATSMQSQIPVNTQEICYINVRSPFPISFFPSLIINY